MKEDAFVPRVKQLLEMAPKGIIVAQQSWRPDVRARVPCAVPHAMAMQWKRVQRSGTDSLHDVAYVIGHRDPFIS